jgi:ribose transport system substrate-binding protein
MKKMFLAICAIALLASTAMAGEKVIGFSNRDMDSAFFRSLSDGISAMGKDLGFKVIASDAAGDFNKQIADVEDLIAQGIDYLILNPQDPKAGLRIVQSANKAGIPVILVDSGIDGASVVTAVAASNDGGNFLIGEYAVGQFRKQFGDTPIKLAILSMYQGSYTLMVRRTNFVRGLMEKSLQDHGGLKLDIVQQVYAGGTDEGGLKAMEDILTAHPDVNMVYTESAVQVRGAVNAIRAAGRSKDIQIYSFDGAKFEYDELKKGTVVATGENSPFKLGQTAVEVVKRYDAGERDFPDVVAPAPILVTPANVDEVYEFGW